MRSPERNPRLNAVENRDHSRGVVWALVYIGDQVGRLVTTTQGSTDLNREVWEDEKRRADEAKEMFREVQNYTMPTEGEKGADDVS